MSDLDIVREEGGEYLSFFIEKLRHQTYIGRQLPASPFELPREPVLPFLPILQFKKVFADSMK